MGAMDDTPFGQAFDALYRALYHRAARRIADGRARLAPETLALLTHLAQAGPSTLTEIASHVGRALSTLSTKLALLETQGLLARQPFEGDGRRALWWLSPLGRTELARARQVLDLAQLDAAAAQLPPAAVAQLLTTLAQLVAALPPPSPDPIDPRSL